jgi:CoA:oxalate CoA-transferase
LGLNLVPNINQVESLISFLKVLKINNQKEVKNLTALKDTRVLDLTHAWQGPICTMFLAAMGAEVLKIEPPWGALGRVTGQMIKGKVDAGFVFLNRGKKGMTLDLKSENGKKIFMDLVKISDVVIENFGPGTMDRLGLGYETLKKINPKIIMASGSGFGQYGPWSKRLSFDPIGRAASGYQYISGLADDPSTPPHHPADAIGDTIPGLCILIGIITALYHREKTGVGQRIDVAQADVMLGVLNSFTIYHLIGKTWQQLMSSRGMRLGGTLKAKDGWVQISVPMGRISDRFTEALGLGPLVDEAAPKKVEEWVAKRTRQEVVDILVKARVPVASVDSLDEVAANPQFHAREMIIELDHPTLGKVKTTGFPIKFSNTPGKIDNIEPELGQHNEEILTELLGYSAEEFATLNKEHSI